MTDILRCRHCGEVIGAYEPLVALDGRRPRLGSRLTLPAHEDSAAAYYHRSCFFERHGDSEIGE